LIRGRKVPTAADPTKSIADGGGVENFRPATAVHYLFKDLKFILLFGKYYSLKYIRRVCNVVDAAHTSFLEKYIYEEPKHSNRFMGHEPWHRDIKNLWSCSSEINSLS